MGDFWAGLREGVVHVVVLLSSGDRTGASCAVGLSAALEGIASRASNANRRHPASSVRLLKALVNVSMIGSTAYYDARAAVACYVAPTGSRAAFLHTERASVESSVTRMHAADDLRGSVAAPDSRPSPIWGCLPTLRFKRLKVLEYRI